jgi:tetratricopeptide (TPR) repeat protein
MYRVTFLLAVGLGRVGAFDESATLARDAAAIAAMAYGERSGQHADALSFLSWISRRTGEGEEALAAARKTRDILSSLFDADAGRALNADYEIGRSLAFLGRHEEAVEVATEALVTAERSLGSTHAMSLNLASLIVDSLMALGRFDEADRLGRRTLANGKGVDGFARFIVADMVRDLADLHRTREDWPAAESVIADGLEILGEDEGPEQMRTGLRERLAWAWLRQGRIEEGDTLYRQTIADARERFSERVPDVFGRVLASYAEWLDVAGRTDEAAAWRREHATEIEAGAALLAEQKARLDRLEAILADLR